MTKRRQGGQAKDEAVRRVAFYTRISTDDTRQKYSLGAQRDRLRAFCTGRYGMGKWRLTRVYSDQVSGTKETRKGLDRLRREARNGLDEVLVFRVDRLARRVGLLTRIVDELASHGVTICSVTEPFDTSTAAGKMMLQMLGVFAGFEREAILARTSAGRRRKAKSGGFTGKMPFGYSFSKEGVLVPKENEAVIVRDLFRLAQEEETSPRILAMTLNRQGKTRRGGKLWRAQRVRYTLRNPVYIGRIRPRGEPEMPGIHEPLVSNRVFGVAQAVAKTGPPVKSMGHNPQGYRI